MGGPTTGNCKDGPGRNMKCSRRALVYLVIVLIGSASLIKETFVVERVGLDSTGSGGTSKNIKHTTTDDEDRFFRKGANATNRGYFRHVGYRAGDPEQNLREEDNSTSLAKNDPIAITEQPTPSTDVPENSIKDETVNGTTNQSTSSIISYEKGENFTILKEETLSFIESRRAASEGVGFGPNWWMRGLGYLWEIQNIALAMPKVAAVSLDDVNRASPVVVKIINVHPNATGKDCDKLSIWVRVRGPEIVAARATAVVNGDNACHWEYHADVRVAGDYAIDAKVLSWNAKAFRQNIAGCNTTNADNVPEDILSKYPDHSGFKGFKMYNAAYGCCQFCSRIPGCVYWTAPPFKMKDPTTFNNGCELIFDGPSRRIPRSFLLHDLNTTWTTNSTRRLRRRLKDATKFEMGPSHNGPKLWFIGCGWSQFHTLDFPCLSGDLDDKVYSLDNTFALATAAAPAPSTVELPLCELKDEFNGTTRGRWVREAWPEDCPPLAYDRNRTKFDVVQWVEDKPHCWHRDDLSRIGKKCIEMNCRLIGEETKYKSPMRDKLWFGVWRDRDCDYYEYTDAQLQQCFDQNKISKVIPEGRSIADFIFEYVIQRIANLRLYEGQDGVTLVASTLGILHMSALTADQIHEKLLALNPSASTKKFIMSPLFSSSERDTGSVVETAEQIFDIAMEYGIDKNASVLNSLESSVAWTFDAATQMDGMHLIGPPMKLVVTKMFHYLCKDSIDGSRM